MLCTGALELGGGGGGVLDTGVLDGTTLDVGSEEGGALDTGSLSTTSEEATVGVISLCTEKTSSVPLLHAQSVKIKTQQNKDKIFFISTPLIVFHFMTTFPLFQAFLQLFCLTVFVRRRYADTRAYCVTQLKVPPANFEFVPRKIMGC